MDEDIPDAERCVKCGHRASINCHLCEDAPVYQDDEPSELVYCGDQCLEEHLPIHAAACELRRKRMALDRAAYILRDLFLQFRKVLFGAPVIGTEITDNELRLIVDVASRPLTPWYHAWPDYLLSTETSYRRGALSTNQCNSAVSFCSPLFHLVFEDLVKEKEIFVLELTPTRNTRLYFPDGTAVQSEGGRPWHTIIVVTLDNEERWVIDLTGNQFGFKDYFVPEQKYMSDHGCTVVNGPYPYSDNMMHDLDHDHFSPDQVGYEMYKQRCTHERAGRTYLEKYLFRELCREESPYYLKSLVSIDNDWAAKHAQLVSHIYQCMKLFLSFADGKLDPSDINREDSDDESYHDENHDGENHDGENHDGENHHDEDHHDEDHHDEDHRDEDNHDENNHDENHQDENHNDENHHDENQG
ncbi:hypothetical protein F4804DRAFT_354084 [Jackrogersella minutella]|nr:hypothetical protein F4804DRAFT_354084 [Jackrogersella minutella]